MRTYPFIAAFLVGLSAMTSTPAADKAPCPATLDFTKKLLANEQTVNLCEQYRGKVVLIVNVASKCGFTHQYEGLEALYRTYKDRGFVVLGFPSNDFGAQEPGSAQQIQEFCKNTYGVEFPMFEKTRAAQAEADPLFRTLAKIAGEYPQWNFHKYLLDRTGKLSASFPSREEPQSARIIGKIESLL